MAKCENCADDATYSIENPGAQHQKFCKEHLPKILNPLNLPAYVKALVSEVEKVVTPKASKKKVEEPAPVVEAEPVVETPVESEPAAE
jgi:hypothetical protein